MKNANPNTLNGHPAHKTLSHRSSSLRHPKPSNLTLGSVLCFMGSLALGLLLAPSLQAQSKKTVRQCQAQSKQAAKIAYDECLANSFEGEADDLRKEYENKYTRLKNQYEQKLKTLERKLKKTDTSTASLNDFGSDSQSLPSSRKNSPGGLPKKNGSSEPQWGTQSSSTESFEIPAPVQQELQGLTHSEGRTLSDASVERQGSQSLQDELKIQLKPRQDSAKSWEESLPDTYQPF